MTTERFTSFGTEAPEAVTSVLDAFSQPAALLSGDYEILATNLAYRELFPGNDVIGRPCYVVSHGYRQPCDLEGELCPLKQCKQTATRQRVLHLHNTCHGQEHVDVEMLPMPAGTTRPEYFLEIMHQVKVANATPQGEGLVGSSQAFNQMISLIQRAAPSDISVLLQGESGTGKELVAKALHQASSRSKQAFVTVECSGLSETLFESEMFGHEKGAFTGAINKKQGLVEAARGGTLFLDEVGDIPLSLQVKLLRLIETGTFRAVGGVELKHASFRLVAATHKDLKAEVAAGRFRQDLYYRINTFPIRLPSLRERRDDLPLLIRTLLKRIEGGDAVQLSRAAIKQLQQYDFPGNIRELRNVLERSILLSDNAIIDTEQLTDIEPDRMPGEQENSLLPSEFIPLKNLESCYLAQVKKTFQGSNSALAAKLGVSERTLYRKLKNL